MICVPDIEYDATHGLALDLYLPLNLKADACIIYAHGGGFNRGSRDEVEAAYFAERLTQEGFALASVSYRLGTPMSAFSEADQERISAYAARSRKVGLTLSDRLFGPALFAAMEDISKAIEYLQFEGRSLGLGSRNTGILGVSAGGIAGMSLAYPPVHWKHRLARPNAVVSICGAMVQPWRLEAGGPNCLMLHGPRDRIIHIGNLHLVAARAQQVDAPVQLIDTGVKGHATQVDVVLDRFTGDGVSYIDIVANHFETLRPAA